MNLVKYSFLSLVIFVFLYIINIFSKKQIENIVSFKEESNKSKENIKVKVIENLNESNHKITEENLKVIKKSEDFKNSKVFNYKITKDSNEPDKLILENNNSRWVKSSPEVIGEMKNKNFMNPIYNIGFNSINKPVRNANIQLRSEPPNPQVLVSLWQQSTIEPDTNRLSISCVS